MTPDEDLPPVESDPLTDPNWTPPIVHEPVATPAPAYTGKVVEVTRIPTPTVVGGRVIFPQANGVDYTVDDKVLTGSQPLKGDLKVKAVARKGYKFTTGLTQTFNLKG